MFKLTSMLADYSKVIAGGIQTQFWANTPKPILPENSLYQFDKDLVEWHMAGNNYEHLNEPVKGVAEKIVRNALKSRPKVRLWVGGETWLVWLGSNFAPYWLLVCSPKEVLFE
jgi:hypothetical protein